MITTSDWLPVINLAATIGRVILVVGLVDITTGIVHWAMDSYGHPDTPITGRLYIVPNILHHRQPREFMSRNYLQSSWDLLLIGALIVAGAWALGRLTWEVWLYIGLGSNAILFHMWMHRTRKGNGPLISLLHDMRLLQTPRHHARHHSGSKDSHYCTLTNALNPLLDAMGVWRFLERMVLRVFGVSPRSADPVARDASSAVRSSLP